MGINLDKIQGALDRFDPEKRKAAGSSDNVIKLEEGENTIRIVPYKYDEEMPFREFHFHYRIDGKTFVCPEKHGDEKCPVCEFVKKAWSEFNRTEDEDWKKSPSQCVHRQEFLYLLLSRMVRTRINYILAKMQQQNGGEYQLLTHQEALTTKCWWPRRLP